MSAIKEVVSNLDKYKTPSKDFLKSKFNLFSKFIPFNKIIKNEVEFCINQFLNIWNI